MDLIKFITDLNEKYDLQMTSRDNLIIKVCPTKEIVGVSIEKTKGTIVFASGDTLESALELLEEHLKN